MAIKQQFRCNNCGKEDTRMYAVSYGLCTEVSKGIPLAIDQNLSQELLCIRCMREIGKILSKLKNKRW